MRPIRTLIAVVFIAAIAITGCNAHTNADKQSPPPSARHHPCTPAADPVDRQAPIYAAVLRQYLTSGGRRQRRPITGSHTSL